MSNLLTSSLNELSILDSDNGSNAGKDITDLFFETTAKIPFGTIVKSPSFPLLHGTHALEMLNPRLDSYILKEIHYQRNPLTESHALGIATGLLRALACWLGDNVSLSNSLFGYEPVCDLLDQYEQNGDLGFLENATGSWDDVINHLIVGVIGCVKFILNCGLQGVVYEDEDITTRTMDFNCLHQVPTDEILNHLSRINKWTENEAILKISNILTCWINFEQILTWQLKPFHSSSLVKSFQNQISNVLKDLDFLNDLNDIGDAPLNCFNTNALRKYNNFIPPKPVSQLPWGETIVNLKQMFEDTYDVLELNSMESTLEMHEWLNYLMNKRHNNDKNPDEILGIYVVSRMILQLFLIRDDESIFGDPNYKISDLLWSWMKQISLLNSSLDIHKDHFHNQINDILDNLKIPFNQELTCYSQNPSRQRQIMCKSVLFWDKFQAELPPVEGDMNKVIADVHSETQKPLMPLLTFIYYQKLEKMIQIILKSIELNLYKDVRELTNGYFVLIYEIDHLLEHLNRLKDLYNYRIDQLGGYPKKIKKLSGERRSKLKREYELKKSQLESIELILKYWDYKINYFTILKLNSELKLTSLQILCSLGFNKLTPLASRRVSMDILYRLQWKCFNSIGIPALPTFDELNQSLQSFKGTFDLLKAEDKINRINILVQDHMKQVSSLINDSMSLINQMGWTSSLVEVFNEQLQALKKEAVTSQLELSQMLKLIKETTINGGETEEAKYKVQINTIGRHAYFPGLKLLLEQGKSIA